MALKMICLPFRLSGNKAVCTISPLGRPKTHDERKVGSSADLNEPNSQDPRFCSQKLRVSKTAEAVCVTYSGCFVGTVYLTG